MFIFYLTNTTVSVTDVTYDLSLARAALSESRRPYDGSAFEPGVTVTSSGGAVLERGADYELEFAAGADRVVSDTIKMNTSTCEF